MPNRTVVRRQPTVPSSRELGWGFAIQTLIAAGMVVALARLWPYYCEQQQRQRVLETELTRTETQVQALQQQFQRTFDPRRQPRLQQAATQQLQPHQRLVIWVSPPR
ncbi:MAG: hypothetical protein NZL92_02595 [Gloeomargarita sp. SKYG116]|nr:hypothetical protein [Gloeomargarita sp. SKYG116]MDW8400567.1 hypothetical protein [Gloeomargarita sp. SKYGB_i_bin116]